MIPRGPGKPAGDDLREGKRTVLVAIARDRATAAQRELLDRRLGDRLLDEAGAEEIRSILAGTGALAECELMIDSSVARGAARARGRAHDQRGQARAGRAGRHRDRAQ